MNASSQLTLNSWLPSLRTLLPVSLQACIGRDAASMPEIDIVVVDTGRIDPVAK